MKPSSELSARNLDATALIAAAVSVAIPLLIFNFICCYCCRSRKKESSVSIVLESYSVKPEASRREAQRWYRQADIDFQAAENDYVAEFPAFEWVCFKCHQSAEKAIKAYLFLKRQKTTKAPSHDLQELTAEVKDGNIVEVATELQNTVGFSSNMRYPDRYSGSKIPHDAYNKHTAEKAMHLTKMLLDNMASSYPSLLDM